MKQTILVALLGLAACHGGDARKTDDHAKAAKPDARARTTSLAFKRYSALMVFMRDGAWRPIRMSSDGTQGMVASDAKGGRLLVMRWPAGYDVYQIDEGCKPVHGAVIKNGRGAQRDDLTPREDSPKARFDVALEVHRLCTTPAGADQMQGSIESAMAVLRKSPPNAQSLKPVMPTQMPAMTAADRAAAADATKRYREAHPDWTPAKRGS